MFEVTQQINEVRREVGDRTLETGRARCVSVSQTYAAPIEDVWDACTDPERIARWFLPVSGELRVGGRYQLQGNAGGTVRRCEPPTAFDATWEFGDQVSWIEVRLNALPDGGTRFLLEHIAHVDEHWGEYGPGAVGIGWDLALLGLATHLNTGKPVDQQEAQAFLGTPDGHRFVVASSHGWCTADIAGGADPAGARAAADRTTAAYTPAADPAGDQPPTSG